MSKSSRGLFLQGGALIFIGYVDIKKGGEVWHMDLLR